MALTGCQVFFPREDTPPDAPPAGAKVTGKYFHRVARNTADGTIIVQDVGASDATIQVRYDTSELIDVVIDADGTFEFPKLTNGYALISSLEDGQELDETADSLVLVNFEAGRDNVEPVTQPTGILLPQAMNDGRIVATVGQWSTVTIDAAQTIAWKGLAGSGDRPLGLLDHREHDRLYVLELTDNEYSEGQRAVRAATIFDEVVMADGMDVDLSAMPLPPPHGSDNCVTLAMQLQPEIDAMLDAAPDFSVQPAMGPTYAMVAVPSPKTSIAGASPIVVPRPVNPLGFDLSTPLEIKSYNPFAGHASMVSVFVLASRSVELPDPNPALGLGITYSQFLEVPKSPACPNNVVVKPIEPGFAVDFAVNGTKLTADNTPIEIQRPSEATITWSANGKVDFFDVTLFEAVNRSGKTELDSLRAYRTRVPQIRVPDSLLGSQRRFVVRVNTLVGFPNVAMGDYATLEYPITNASMVSRPFVVP